MAKFNQIVNNENIKEFEILNGKYKGYIISWWRNRFQHISLMQNKTTCFGEELYFTKQKKGLTPKQILEISEIILRYKQIQQ